MSIIHHRELRKPVEFFPNPRAGSGRVGARTARRSLYAAGMASSDDPTGQTGDAARPSRADAIVAHAENSISEDALDCCGQGTRR